jgi:DNA-directed RNA polymerase subunit RPC12/RpoP
MQMKLEGLDGDDDEERFFCGSCGKQLHATYEISQRICHECKQGKIDSKEEKVFFCWACGKPLAQMSEVAQGLCHGCKSSIIRKIQKHPTKQETKVT